MPLSFTRQAQVPFFEPPEICTNAVGPRVAIGFNFRSIPQSRFRFSRSVPDAAGCRTPRRRSPTGGRPPSDLRSRSRPQEESGRQGLAVLSPPPRILARENRIPPSRRRESLRSLVRRWQVGYHPKSLQAPLRAYVAIHAGVVSSKHGWNSDTVSSTSRPQGIKWTTTCLEAMILSVYVR